MHGKRVIELLDDQEGFIKEWRLFFLDSMNPLFLPQAWNVNHQIYRSFGEQSKFKSSEKKVVKN